MSRHSIVVFGVALLLAATRAPAQGLDATETADADGIINIAECDGTAPDGLAFAWTAASFAPGGTYTLTASDTVGCPAPTLVTFPRNVLLGANLDGSSARGLFPPTGSLSVARLLQDLAINCNSPATMVSFCVDLSGAGGGRVASSFILLDLLVPLAPVALAAAAGENSLVISWRQGSGAGSTGPIGATDAYRVSATSTLDPLDTHGVVVTGGGSTSTRISGLTGGTTYDVTVAALSPGGNPSASSNTIQGTPVQSAGGGPDGGAVDRGGTGVTARSGGGCSAAPGNLLALLLGGLVLARRLGRERRA